MKRFAPAHIDGYSPNVYRAISRGIMSEDNSSSVQVSVPTYGLTSRIYFSGRVHPRVSEPLSAISRFLPSGGCALCVKCAVNNITSISKHFVSSVHGCAAVVRTAVLLVSISTPTSSRMIPMLLASVLRLWMVPNARARTLGLLASKSCTTVPITPPSGRTAPRRAYAKWFRKKHQKSY